MALIDAQAHLTSSTTTAIASDSLKACRNTVLVLITAGKDDGDVDYTDAYDAQTLALSFGAGLNFGGGVQRKVPIIVIGLETGGRR